MDLTDRASLAADEPAALFARQRAAFAAQPCPERRLRVDRLARLEAVLHEDGEALVQAIAADFGHRSHDETRLLELFPSLAGIRHARRHVGAWMRRRRAGVSIYFQPGRAFVLPQPLGVAGIVAPWNYPLLLTIGPLTSALAAGNRALVKVSELTPRTGAVLAQAIATRFGADELAVVQGDAAVGAAFSRLPFDHLLFTGSTRVGVSVMRAAADNLTPVTLELGGKSPAIVAPGYPLAHAAQRIMVGKCMNAGQTCIAPDYVLVPEDSVDAFAAQCRAEVDALYPALARSDDYSSIVNERHFTRLMDWLDEAKAAGARIVALSSDISAPDAHTRRFPPLAVLGAPESTRVMQEEIFGPLLPLVPYRDFDAALAYVAARARPLALYLFDRERARIDAALARTHAGGVTVNDTILHIAQDNLPFGGVGASGMGAYHGRAGFDTFSKLKPVFVQSRFNTIGLFKPPYGARFRQLVRLLLRAPW